MKRTVLKIGQKEVDSNKLFFVVEEGQVNQGNLKKALRMIDAAAMTGADAIEFQLAKAEDFYVKSHDGYSIYLKREFKIEQIKEIVAYTKDKKMEFIAVALSHKLINPLAKLGCSAFNVNASDLTNPDIIDTVAESGKPFFLSLALASEKEIDWAIKRVTKKKAVHYALLYGQHVMASGEHGVDPKDTNLGFISTLKERYGVPVGFVDHTPFKWFPAIAAAAGADIITKHITLSHSDKCPDYQVCLEPGEMKEAVGLARKTRKSIVLNSRVLAPGENMDRAIMRRSIVAARKMKAGSIIKRPDICFKRPGTGVCPSEFEAFIGKRVLRDIEPDEQLRFTDLEVK